MFCDAKLSEFCVQWYSVAQLLPIWTYSPCIMCLQYRGGYHEYRGDILSTVGDVQYRGDIMIIVGDILSTVGVHYRGGYHDARRRYHEYRGGCSVLWRYHDNCGGYLEYSGCSLSWGIS